MKEREELELILKLIGKYNLPLSPILEYTVKEKMEEYPEEERTAALVKDEMTEESDNSDEVFNTSFLPKSYDIKLFCLSALTCLKGLMDNRTYQILNDMLNGESRSTIALKHSLTQERIRQIVVKATKQAKELLIEQRNSLEKEKEDNARLNVQLNLMREDIVRLKSLLPKEAISDQKDIDEDLDAELIELLEIPIEDINLPVRAVNVLLFMEVKKFVDIPQIESYMKLFKARNSGRKTVHDISCILEDFHLTFGMSYTEIVNILKVKDWHSAKKKWIKESEHAQSKRNLKDNNNNEKKTSTDIVSKGATTKATQVKVDKRIGFIVKLFPSQQVGEIVDVRVDGKGINKLVVRTNEGNMIAVDDLPYLYEILKRDAHSEVAVNIMKQERTESVIPEAATIKLTEEMIEAARTPNGGFTKSQLAAIGIGWPPPQDWIKEKVGTMITPTQLEAFNHIEYVANPSSESFNVKGSETYKNVASSLDDRRKMEAILQAMTHFYAPATPYDIARTISRTAWGGNVVRVETVDSFLKLLPEVEYVKWGKYILKSRTMPNGKQTSSTLTDSKIAVKISDDKRIGYTVRLFPSQLKGEIIRVRKDTKGIKKLVIKTTSGHIVEVDDLPYLYEVLKRK